jgi:hypothetical protein
VLTVTSCGTRLIQTLSHQGFNREDQTMFTLNSKRSLTLAAVTGAAFALMISAQTAAFAQNNAPDAITQSAPAKQVGLWMVNGWKRGNVGTHCSAERPLRGAAGGGGTLQFVLVRFPGGYRIALGAEDWNLKPQTAFPVELIAPPVLQTDANAVAVTPKLVVIDLGADVRFMQKLATAPEIDVKASQTVFKLPLEGFSDALAEVDACYSSLKRAASNPFAPVESPKTASAQ